MYKILSLDGGGSWAILQLLTLQKRYPDLRGHDILKEFDLVIANSGGSIVLTALAENYNIAEALALFDRRKNREKIFSINKFKERFFPVDYLRLFSDFGPKYSSKRKKEAFEHLFPKVNGKQMIDLPVFIGKDSLKIIVCTYDALNNRAKFFKSYMDDEYFDSVTLTQAAHGSSNAPIQYFDFPARFKAKNSETFYELWDGALGGFNNPVAAGVVEAVKLGVHRSEIKVISVGTGNSLMSIEDKERFYTVKDISTRERKNKIILWKLKYQLEFFTKSILNQAKTILYQPPDWANYVAYMFLFSENYRDPENLKRFVRLSPLIHRDDNTPPDAVALLKDLYTMDMDLTEDNDIEKLKHCFSNWEKGVILNQPIEYKVLRDNRVVSLIGHKTFDDAMNDW